MCGARLNPSELAAIYSLKNSDLRNNIILVRNKLTKPPAKDIETESGITRINIQMNPAENQINVL